MKNKQRKEYQYKIVIVGDLSVGKTCLLNRFAYNTFNQKYQWHNLAIQQLQEQLMNIKKYPQNNIKMLYQFGILLEINVSDPYFLFILDKQQQYLLYTISPIFSPANKCKDISVSCKNAAKKMLKFCWQEINQIFNNKDKYQQRKDKDQLINQALISYKLQQKMQLMFKKHLLYYLVTQEMHQNLEKVKQIIDLFRQFQLYNYSFLFLQNQYICDSSTIQTIQDDQLQMFLTYNIKLDIYTTLQIRIRMNQNYDLVMKIVMFGDIAAGKSSLCLRFSENNFYKQHSATVGIDIINKIIQSKKSTIKLQIWDHNNSRIFYNLLRPYFLNALGVVLIYDITDRQTFQRVRTLNTKIDEFGSESICKILIGNKSDLQEKRQVKLTQGIQLANQLGIQFLQASACDAVNVQKAFTMLVNIIKASTKR